MNRISAGSLLAIGLLASLSAACSSTDEETPEAPIVLRGAYVPKSASSSGEIGLLFIESPTRYYLRNKSCSDIRCEEHGSFVFDKEQHSLDLVVDGSGRAYSLPFEVLATREEKNDSSTRPATVASPRLTPADTTPTPSPAADDDEKEDKKDDGTLVNKPVELTLGPVSLIVTDVSVNGEAFSGGDGWCGETKVYNGTGTYETTTYLGSDRDRKNVGDAACAKAKEDAERSCTKSPYVCTAKASGTTALEPECSGTLTIKCTCFATTKCSYTSPF